MSQIINNESISQEQILANIQEFVKTLPNYNDIKDNLDVSTLGVIYQLLAGTGTWALYNYNRLRTETYLTTAILEKSINNLSRQFGYNISRATAPRVQMIYSGAKTVVLSSGTKIGTYKDYEVFYFGKSTFIEAGDKVTGVIGIHKTHSQIVQYPADGTISKDLLPEELTSIDNELISVFTRTKNYEVTKSVEDYIVFREIADFSISPTETKLYISDNQFNYGVSDLAEGDTLNINWVETDGYIPNLALSDVKGIDDNWSPVQVLTNGTNSEDKDKIKAMVPFYYSTMRRAVTDRDYTYIAKAHSLIRDAYSTTERGIPGVWTLNVVGSVKPEQKYSVSLNGNISYSVTATLDDTITSVLNRLKQAIEAGRWASVMIQDHSMTISNVNARVDMSPVGSSNLFGEAVEVTKQEAPPCCTQSVFYVKHNQTRDGEISILTDDEKLAYAKHIQTYKMAGVTILLSPAKRATYQIKLKISISNKELVAETGQPINEFVRDEVLKILEKNYEFQLNKAFNYAEFIAQVTKIQTTINNSSVQPVIAVNPNQVTFNVEPKEDTYIVFLNTEIDFE